MTEMLLYLDASTHRWTPEQPMSDLNVMLDDADGRMLCADVKRRFTVRPAQSETACIRLAGIGLDLVLSIQHDRVVRNDSTVTCNRLGRCQLERSAGMLPG